MLHSGNAPFELDVESQAKFKDSPHKLSSSQPCSSEKALSRHQRARSGLRTIRSTKFVGSSLASVILTLTALCLLTSTSTGSSLVHSTFSSTMPEDTLNKLHETIKETSVPEPEYKAESEHEEAKGEPVIRSTSSQYNDSDDFARTRSIVVVAPQSKDAEHKQPASGPAAYQDHNDY